MDINVSDLRKVCAVLLDHLEATGNAHIRVDWDHYWNVPKEERYDKYDSPKNLDLGQLTYDWERLQGLLNSEEVPIAYGLVWLSSILRAVGEKIVS
jgi:hypothetical protein